MSTPVSGDPYWTHDLDPWIVHFGGNWGIRWYGTAYLVGLLVGWWLLRRWRRRGQLPLPQEGPGDAVLYLGLGMIVGGRLGYCLFYKPELLITFTDAFPFWGLLAVHQGGMASHGGIIGFLIGTWLLCRRHRISLWVLADAVATAIPVGIICGRIANFINGELWGRVTDVAWAVRFPHAPDMDPRHPSQLYAVVLEGLIPLLVALWALGRHRRPGLNSGIVLTLYSIGRFIGEFFRQPDTHLGTVLGPFSMGQVLTVPVFLLGVGLLYFAGLRPPRPDLYRQSATTPGANATKPRAATEERDTGRSGDSKDQSPS